MTIFEVNQQRFTQGEIDPNMIGRVDIDQYYGALETATNIFTLPQGGYKRRPGLEHIDRVLADSLLIKTTISAVTTPNGGTGANAYDTVGGENDGTTLLTTTTPIGTIDPYVIVQYDFGVTTDIENIYLYGAGLSNATSSDFYMQGSSDAVTWTNIPPSVSRDEGSEDIRLRQSPNTDDFVFRVHAGWRYIRLAKVGGSNLGSAVASISGMFATTGSGVSNTRCIPFEFNVDQTYKMVLSHRNIAIYKDDEYLIDVYVNDLTSTRIPDVDWEADADTLILFHPDVETITLQRNGADDVWTKSTVSWSNIPVYAFDGASTSLPAGTIQADATTGFITFTGVGTNFTAGAYEGQYINLVGSSTFGRVFVTNVISTTVLEGNVVEELSGTGIIANNDWQLEDGYEEVWSSTRGWPRHGRFYENRLWVDGGKARPSVVYASKVNDFFNFDFGTALADEAIGPLTGGFDDIEAIYPGRSLMIFTSDAEYIVPQTFGDPVTPGTAQMRRQSSIGSEERLRPQEVEGGVLYVQRGGASIQEFIYQETTQAFGNNFVSLLSSHLVKNPVDLAIRKSASNEEGSYLLLVRSNGDLTVANMLRSENVTSFVRATTNGSFKSCGVDGNDMFFVVEREINGETINWLERFNDDHYLDASKVFTENLPKTTFTHGDDDVKLRQLKNVECRVRADDYVVDNETPSAATNPTFTVTDEVNTDLEIGLDFNPTVKDLPAPLLSNEGTSILGRKMCVHEIVLRIKDTEGLVINGKSQNFREFTGSGGTGTPLDTVVSYTGIWRTLGWLGWDDTGQVTITQTDPQPMTVLAHKKRMET